MSKFILAPEGQQLRDIDVWGPLYDAKNYGTIISARVERVKRQGGDAWEIVFEDAPDIIGYVPAEETGLPQGTRMDALKNSVISVKVLEINRKEETVICSRKEVVNISLTKLLAALEIGQEISSIVKCVDNRNVYLDIGGGVIKKIPATKVRFSDGVPLDVQYQLGSKVNVTVTNLNKEDRDIEVEPINPWEKWTFTRGEVLYGTVVDIRDTDLFVSVKPGLIALAPYRAGDNFALGDRIEFQITTCDATKRKLHLILWDPKKAAQRRREKHRAKARREAAQQLKSSQEENKIITGVFLDKASGADESPGGTEE